MSLRPGQSRRPLVTISAQDLQLKSERTLLTPKKSAAKISKAYPEHDVNENMKENIYLPSTRDTVNDQVHSSKLEPIHSPTLSKLREGDTGDSQGVLPKRGDSKITAKQRELVRKHQEAKSNLEKCPGIGGGVTMWPAMDDMRLSKRETLRLLMLSAFIIVGCTVVFFYLHGSLISTLDKAHHDLARFPQKHPLVLEGPEEAFRASLKQWHKGFHLLIISIEKTVNVDWKATSSTYSLFWLMYICGVCGLLYLFIENVFARNRLSPKRIQVWVMLLCIISTWTVLALGLLMKALKVEEQSKAVVFALSDELVDIMFTEWDLQLFETILHHWRAKCLPPSTTGIISVLGVVKLQDLVYYLSYYSLPIVTAIFLPIAKIFVSVYRIYCPIT